jgi:uncharacterized protein YggE
VAVALGVALLGVVVGSRVGSLHGALADSTPPIPTVSVTGEGIVTAPPDVVVLQLGVSVEAGTVADARTQAAAAAAAVVAAVKADGVADDDVKTVQFNIGPRYDNVSGRQTLRGYDVSNVLQVKIRALDSVGKVIDDATAAGGDAIVVQGINYAIENTDPLAHQARMQAMSNAKTKAADFAASVGMSVGRVDSIQEETSVAPSPVQFATPAPSAAAAPRTPIETGTLQVQVRVSVVFEMQ